MSPRSSKEIIYFFTFLLSFGEQKLQHGAMFHTEESGQALACPARMRLAPCRADILSKLVKTCLAFLKNMGFGPVRDPVKLLSVTECKMLLYCNFEND